MQTNKKILFFNFKILIQIKSYLKPRNYYFKMDVFTLVEGYMNKMFSGVEGMKILLVDHETVK
jgi:hypothetical protein